VRGDRDVWAGTGQGRVEHLGRLALPYAARRTDGNRWGAACSDQRPVPPSHRTLRVGAEGVNASAPPDEYG